MPSQIRAVALDYDGTLATDCGPTPAVLDAIAETRARGLRVVLVTGRILSELRAVFPDALDRFDAVVAENGAVIGVGRRERALASSCLSLLPHQDELTRSRQRNRFQQAPPGVFSRICRP